MLFYWLFEMVDWKQVIKNRWKLLKPWFESYSQCGEDLIISGILGSRHKIKYVDVGAGHPKLLSNTFLFYRRGGKGVCVEANPEQFNKLKRVRKKDLILFGAVVPKKELNSKLTFFVTSPPEVSTFDITFIFRSAHSLILSIESLVEALSTTITS